MSDSESPSAPATTTTSITTPSPSSLPAAITLRAPGTTAFTAPATAWLCTTWYVTHSTLPLWRSARNVRITYRALADPSLEKGNAVAAAPPQLDDLVTYQSLDAAKQKQVAGIDTSTGAGAYRWRGKGWLGFVSSRWEILGFGGRGQDGGVEDATDDGGDGGDPAWLVTYFAKTLFTPAGIDIYSRRPQGLPPATLNAIRAALGTVEHAGVRALAAEMLVVKSDFY